MKTTRDIILTDFMNWTDMERGVTRFLPELNEVSWE